MIVKASVNPEGKEELKSYSEKSSVIFKEAGAKPVQKLAIDRVLVGEEKPDLMVISEWPSKKVLLDVFESEVYKAIIPLRDAAFLTLEVFISN